MADGELILIAGALLAAGMLASLVAGRLRVPGLLLFLFLGMGIGSDGLDLIEFDDYELARRIGIIALALILFEGGLTAGPLEIRPVLGPAISLAIVGTVVTAVVTGLAASALFDLSTLDGMLLGAILAATDGAAIFALLRGSSLKRRLATTLEGESGLNDPVAVLLVLGFIEWLQHDDYGLADMAVLFVRQLGIGLAIGLLVGAAAWWTLQRVRMTTAGLYPVATLAVAALAFGGADALHGSGFLAVYLAGLALGLGEQVLADHGGQGEAQRRGHAGGHHRSHDLEVAAGQGGQPEGVGHLVDRSAHVEGHHQAEDDAEEDGVAAPQAVQPVGQALLEGGDRLADHDQHQRPDDEGRHQRDDHHRHDAGHATRHLDPLDEDHHCAGQQAADQAA